jgi:hypothetical protein
MRRVAIALLAPPRWSPPGIDPAAWRVALAEDVVDLLATLAEVDAAIATAADDRAVAAELVWPGMPVYEVDQPTVVAALHAAAAAGYEQAAVLAADAPDLPGLLVGKLLQPLTTRLVAVAPSTGGGLLGLASRLPPPDWLPHVDLDTAIPGQIRAAAPRPGVVAETPEWHRLRAPEDLARLDVGLEGWPATRALLGG